MSKRAPSPTARRALRSNSKIADDSSKEKNPYAELQKSLLASKTHESHERSVSPRHFSDNEAETDDENNDAEQVNSSSTTPKNQSYDSPQSSPATPRSRGNTSSSSSKVTTPLKNESSSIATPTENRWATTVVAIMALIVLVVAVAVYLSKQTPPDIPESSFKNCEGFFDLSKKYPKIDQDIFLHLKFGVEDLLNNHPCRPSVFLFIHDVDIRSFIDRVVGVSVDCLQTTSPIMLNSQDFKNPEMRQDYGVALAKYKEPLEKSSVLVVYDLDAVPAITAQAFHTICDTYNPLVRKAIILLTVQASASQINATDNANEIAEMRLKEEWTDLAEDKLGPLIARVTDQVFVISSLS